MSQAFEQPEQPDSTAALDFELNEDGTITITGDPSKLPDEPVDTPAPVETVKADPSLDRIQALENKFDQLTNTLLARLGAPQQHSTEPSLEQQLEAAESPAEMATLLKKSVNGLIQDAIKPYQEQISSMSAQLQIQTLVNLHGQAFVDSIPAIKQLMAAVPTLTIEKAYETIRTIQPAKPEPKQQPVSKPAQNLLDKSRNLKLDSSEAVNSQVVSTKREIKTVKDAMMAALEEINAGNTR